MGRILGIVLVASAILLMHGLANAGCAVHGAAVDSWSSHSTQEVLTSEHPHHDHDLGAGHAVVLCVAIVGTAIAARVRRRWSAVHALVPQLAARQHRSIWLRRPLAPDPLWIQFSISLR